MLDTVADLATGVGRPIVVTVGFYNSDGVPMGVQLGIGHPRRSFVGYLGGPDAGYGFEADLPPWPRPIVFDHDGATITMHPDDTRVSPSRAREAAREYVATGTRPACLRWTSDLRQPAG